MTEEKPPARRAVRSFVLRQGRLTSGQRRALDGLWPKFGLDQDQSFDAQAVFGRTVPLIVEIGFGMGDSLIAQAQNQPEHDFIGIEVHGPGVGRLLAALDARDLVNVRVVRGDAVDYLKTHVADNTLAGVQLFFPDPWPKTRHHKRRIVSDAFVELITRKLRPGGYVHTATDWEDYARWMLEHLDRCPGLRNGAPDGGFMANTGLRPSTRFEKRGLRLGHGVWDLWFVKRPGEEDAVS